MERISDASDVIGPASAPELNRTVGVVDERSDEIGDDEGTVGAPEEQVEVGAADGSARTIEEVIGGFEQSIIVNRNNGIAHAEVGAFNLNAAREICDITEDDVRGQLG